MHHSAMHEHGGGLGLSLEEEEEEEEEGGRSSSSCSDDSPSNASANRRSTNRNIAVFPALPPTGGFGRRSALALRPPPPNSGLLAPTSSASTRIASPGSASYRGGAGRTARGRSGGILQGGVHALRVLRSSNIAMLPMPLQVWTQVGTKVPKLGLESDVGLVGTGAELPEGLKGEDDSWSMLGMTREFSVS